MGNICCICLGSSRNAIGDSFKNIVNSFEDKSNIFIIKNSLYKVKEFRYPKENILSIDFNKNKISSYFNIKDWKNILSFIKKKKVEHLFFYSDNPVNFMIALLSKKKYSFWLHDPTPHSGVPFKQKLLKLINDNLLIKGRKLENVIVASNTLQRQTLEKHPRLKNKIKVIYLPIMEELTRYYRPLSIQNRNYDFIFWGRIEDYKGLDILEQAIIELLNWKKKFNLLIIGSGNIEKYVRNDIRERDNIHIINKYVSNKELARYINNSKAAIFPYKDSTGTQTVQTALYFGCEVIATDTGSFREYLTLKNKKIGTIIPPNNVKELGLTMNKILEKDDVSNNFDYRNYAIENFGLYKMSKYLIKVLNSTN